MIHCNIQRYICIKGEIMEEPKSNSSFGPQIAEPTTKEIEETVESVKTKYDIVISESDAINYFKLTKELTWWMMVEKGLNNPDSITEEMAKEVQEFTKDHYANEISLDEATKNAKDSVAHIVPIEKERIAEEIRTIVTNYR